MIGVERVPMAAPAAGLSSAEVNIRLRRADENTPVGGPSRGDVWSLVNASRLADLLRS